MLRNYLNAALRNIIKQKAFSLLNVIGLAVGMAGCLLILQYVLYELSWDKFHTNHENLYRVQYDNYREGKLQFTCAAAVPAVGPAMKDNFPEVLDYARALPLSGTITYGENSLIDDRIQFATPSFIEILTFPLIEGDSDVVLTEPQTCIVSESIAYKLFGDVDPMGKTIRWNDQWDFTINGIFEDVPYNSHIKFDILFSFITLTEYTNGNAETAWGWYDFNTYILLEPGTDHLVFNAKFAEWLEVERGETWEEYNYRQEFILQPITDIHLYSDLLQESEPEENGDGRIVYFLMIIAFFILFIAWVNYINLSTSRAIERAREVGVRKVVGAARRQLINQFVTEAMLLNLFSVVVALIIVILVLPYFNHITGANLNIELLQNVKFWLMVVGLFAAGTLFAGFYPSVVLSSFNPVKTLKGRLTHSKAGTNLRKFLVVFQFAATFVLIVATTTVYRQLIFMQNQDLGFDMESTLVLRGPEAVDSTYNQIYDSFRDAILRNPKINSFTSSTNVPGKEIFWANSARKAEDPEDVRQIIYMIGMDEEYVNSYEIELIGGRIFSREMEGLNPIILNRSAIELFGYSSIDDAIGMKLVQQGREWEIVGVIENYNQLSLKTNPIPLLFRYEPFSNRYFSFKIHPSEIQNTITFIGELFEQYFPGNPYEYFFLDDYFNRQYDSEKRTGRSAGVFALIAVVIACLGLFGLSAYSAVQRTKEIGIRKAMGASIKNIMYILFKEYLVLLIISFLIAVPLVYKLLILWLNNFAYKINLGWIVFVVTGLLVVVLAWISVSYQTLKAARTNPADTLKYE